MAARGSVWARAAEQALASWPCQHPKGSDFPPGGSFLSTCSCSPGPPRSVKVNKNQLSASLCPRSVLQVSWFQHKSYKIRKFPVLKRCTQPLHLCSAGLHALQCCSFSLLTNCTYNRFLPLLMGSEANTKLFPSIASAYQVLLSPSMCCGKGLGCQEL